MPACIKNVVVVVASALWSPLCGWHGVLGYDSAYRQSKKMSLWIELAGVCGIAIACR